MKAIKYLVAGLLVMGLAAPAMAQDVNYKDMLKPIETTLKAGNQPTLLTTFHSSDSIVVRSVQWAMMSWARNWRRNSTITISTIR